MRYGLFHDGHRGLADCEVLLEILAPPLPGSAEPTLKRLLDTARQPTLRVWALDSPFDMKDRLKARGCRWSNGSDGNPRAWYRDVPDIGVEDERQYLMTEVHPGPYRNFCAASPRDNADSTARDGPPPRPDLAEGRDGQAWRNLLRPSHPAYPSHAPSPTGTVLGSIKPTSSTVQLPRPKLQGAQVTTRFSSDVGPPRLYGMT